MRRSKPVRLAWGAKLARGRENARLARAIAAAEDVRTRRQIAGALVWDRAGSMTIIQVMHDAGARTVEAEIAPRGGPDHTRRGLRWPGVAAVVLRAMGFGHGGKP